MAEEEVLVETAAPVKKEKGGGGFSIVHLAIIAVLMIAVTAIGTMVITTKFVGASKEISEQVRQGQQFMRNTGPLVNLQKVDQCEGKKGQARIVQLTPPDKPMIVTLSDGESYLSITISICLKNDFPREEFDARKDIIFHVTNEYLGTFSKSDFFPGGAAKQTVPAGGNLEDSMMAEEFAETKTFTGKKDEVRAGLKMAYIQRGINFVDDVYFTSFLIQ